MIVRRVRLALSFIAACASAIGLYAIIRVVQSLLMKEPNPALIIWSEHAGYFWRSWIVAYAGGMVGFMVWFVSSRLPPERVARAIASAVLVATILIVVQSVFVP